MYRYMHSAAYVSVPVLIHPSISPSIHPTVHLPIHLTIHPSIHPFSSVLSVTEFVSYLPALLMRSISFYKLLPCEVLQQLYADDFRLCVTSSCFDCYLFSSS